MINTAVFYKCIKDMPIETFSQYLFSRQNDIIKGDYNYFIDYLKKDYKITEFICNFKYSQAKIILKKLIEYFSLTGIDIEELYELVKDNASHVLVRLSEWKNTEFQLISDTAKKIKFCCYFAEFNYVNKWGYSSKPITYKAIHDNKHFYWPINRYDEPQFYVLKNNKIYGISYKHKIITIYKCLKRIYDKKTVDFNEWLDGVIAKDVKRNKIDKNKIDLSEHFYTGFFYKGFLYDRNWEKPITIMKGIEFVDGKLKIDIENLTYPHKGYVLLDLENTKIIEAKNIKQTNS
jgi:hypothetical protein